jgi:hypothetical protein
MKRGFSTRKEPFPPTDGWDWIYTFDDKFLRPRRWLRCILKAYFKPNSIEKLRDGRIYRLLGVHLFGKIIPTGGVLIRRLTGLRMLTYTLVKPSLRAAYNYRYKACMFESVHTVFFLVLLPNCIRSVVNGDTGLAVCSISVNLLVNVYPVMFHRYTRVRIDRLIAKSQARIRRELPLVNRPSCDMPGKMKG